MPVRKATQQELREWLGGGLIIIGGMSPRKRQGEALPDEALPRQARIESDEPVNASSGATDFWNQQTPDQDAHDQWLAEQTPESKREAVRKIAAVFRAREAREQADKVPEAPTQDVIRQASKPATKPRKVPASKAAKGAASVAPKKGGN